MLVLQLLRWPQCEKELASIVVFARVRHCYQTSAAKSQTRVKFVFERSPIDTFAASPCPRGVTALDNEFCSEVREESTILLCT